MSIYNETLDSSNAIWDDGEWIGWSAINKSLAEQELRFKYPKADLSLIPVFEELLQCAETYHMATGNHLNVYGDIGEIYANMILGIKLHKNYTQGSDGRIGNDFIEVKTITPLNSTDKTSVKLSGNFNKLFVVKIDEGFEVSGRLINRADLPKRGGKKLTLKWGDLEGIAK